MKSESSGSLERPPPTISDHEMLRQIGGGSYGEVWLAQNTTTGVHRAVKVVRKADFSDDRPYDREFEGVQSFEPISREHVGLVDILQVGHDKAAGFFYYVMELADDAGQPEEMKAREEKGGKAEGIGAHRAINPQTYIPRTLRGVLRSNGDLSNSSLDGGCRLPARQCMEICGDLTSALVYLHKRGRVHRDIKPSNIIFVDDQPKLADIGLVVGVGEERSFVGTEGYVAPEGPGKQSDIYALGKVLYEMVTGFSAKDFWNLPADWAAVPDHAELKELLRIALQACEPNRTRRYKSAAQMYSDLELLKSGKSLFMRKLQHTVQRQRWIITGVAMSAVLLFSLFGVWTFKNRAAEENRRRELREIQISRTRFQSAGWFTNNWPRLQRAAAIRTDQGVLEQATPMLAGLDARPVNILQGVAAGSAAFGPDGRALVGGVGVNSPAMMLDTNGALTELPVRGEGPVCWTPDGVPLQWVGNSNSLVLREAHTGRVRREISIAGVVPSASASVPVLAITPHGTLAVALRDRLMMWKMETGELLGQVEMRASALAFSPDGLLLGAGGADGTTRVYAVPSLSEVAVLPPALRGSPILCLAFTRDRVVRYGVEKGTNSWLLATGDKGAGIVI